MNTCQIEVPDSATAAAVRLACADIFASAAFARAPRMCQLLAFLVEHKLSGKESGISEYAIGLQVFGRDCSSYDTATDPLVRVQVGRLRDRLARYYAGRTDQSSVRIAIPLGHYVPTFDRVGPDQVAAAEQILEVSPLRVLERQEMYADFARGLEEEIGSQLFVTLGAALRLRALAVDVESNESAGGSVPPLLPTRQAQSHRRLEGSIRVESGRVKACMRLVDPRAHEIRWMSQFDCRGRLGIALQEELAAAICGGLQAHLHARHR